MTATDSTTNHASAPQGHPATKAHRATGNAPGRPRKYPEGVKAHLKAVRAEKRAQQAAQAATVASASQSLAAQTPQTVQNSPRPLPPWLMTLQPYDTSEEVEKLIVEGDFELADLGTPCAHAKGLMSALLEHLTHKAAFEATGLKWSYLAIFCAWSDGFDRLYKRVLAKLDEKRVLVLKEAAYERAVKGNERGIYHDGRKIAVEYYPSDKMHELMLRGLDPATFGKVDGEGSQQAVQVNITL